MERDEFIEVWLHVPNWWIEMADVNPEKETEEIECNVNDIPIIELHSQQGLEKFQASGQSIPDSTIILAKMKFEDMIEYVNQGTKPPADQNWNWDSFLLFDVEYGKFKTPSNDVKTFTSRPKMK
ncbi:hypothetical protein [Ralstonia pseudosolanacearum]|uniref:Uncharacterized protein n=1 Tax=Ralstonia solanacearum TaxID=305 RepID=A0ABY6NG03_RALSL|nr:hypothetical protein LH706_06790 [Ralstonia solanacearum]